MKVPVTVKAPVATVQSGKPAASSTAATAPDETTPSPKPAAPAPVDTAPAPTPPASVPVDTPSKPPAVAAPDPVKTPVAVTPAAQVPASVKKAPVEPVPAPAANSLPATTAPPANKVSGAIGSIVATTAPAEVVRVLDKATAPVASLVTAPAPLEQVAGLVVPRLDSATALLGAVTGPLPLASAASLPLGTLTAPTFPGLVDIAGSSNGVGLVPAVRHAEPPAPVSALPITEVGQLELAGGAPSAEDSGIVATTVAAQTAGPRAIAGLEPRTAVPTTVPPAVLPRGPPTSTGVIPAGSTSQTHVTPVPPPLVPEAPGDSPAGGSAYSTSLGSSADVAVLVARLGPMALGPDELRFSPGLRQLPASSSLLERPG